MIQKLKFPFKEWDGSIPYILNQPLEYLAPEYGIANKCDCSSDMFSYGMLFFTVFNEGKTLYKCELSYSKFVSCVEDVNLLNLKFLDNVFFFIKKIVLFNSS
jgi:SCY1-like protein 2